MTIALPFFGLLAQRYNNRLMLMRSVLGTLILLIPLYLSIEYTVLWVFAITTLLIALLCACSSAILPHLLCSIFQTRIRFTGVSLSFNVIDSVIGGFVPLLALFLYHVTGIKASFCFILFPAGIISLMAYRTIKEPSPTENAFENHS